MKNNNLIIIMKYNGEDIIRECNPDNFEDRGEFEEYLAEIADVIMGKYKHKEYYAK